MRKPLFSTLSADSARLAREMLTLLRNAARAAKKS